MIKHSLKSFVTQVRRFDLLSDEELASYNTFLQDINITVVSEKAQRIPGKEAVVSVSPKGESTILAEAEPEQLLVLVRYNIHRDFLEGLNDEQ